MSLTFSDISAWFLIAVAVVFLSNFIKYKGRLKDFDWFVLVLIVALNVSFLVLSFFDSYTFGLLWKKFFVLTVCSVVINVLLNKVIRDRLEEKGEAVNWREDRKFMISLSVVCAALLIGFTGYAMWYTMPHDIERNIEGYHLELNNSEEGENVSVTIDGELSRSFVGWGKYEGKFSIEGEDLKIPSEDLTAKINYRLKDIGFLIYTGWEPQTHQSEGSVVIKGDFNQMVISRFDDGGEIVAPASNREEALELYEKLTYSDKK